MSSTQQPSAVGSRSRPQARKKLNDDSSYFGPPSSTAGTSGAKRPAQDKVDGEPRVKRKRVETSTNVNVHAKRDAPDIEPKLSLVEFHKMPISTLHRYLTQFDIIPPVYPPPSSAQDPPIPAFLNNPQPSRASSPPSLTPANRPRREPRELGRRRSSRLLEEETRGLTPVLADIEEFHNVLAGIVERHFQAMTSVSGREEVETLASFMCAVEKTKLSR